MYDWSVQNAIVAFVDSLRPHFGEIHDAYMAGAYGFADAVSALLTSMGYPPVG